MGTTAPRGTPQLVAFQPVPGRRVISPMTAAEMKQMMQGVVLRGTGTRAILNGYSVAGKTGTAQKTDPDTGAYSKSQYIASFTGFAPVNNPALTVLVVLDSPVGPSRADHEGGFAAAPVFARVAQQVLAYWNVPHDVEVLDQKQFALRKKVKEEDVAEGSPQHISVEAEAVAPATLSQSTGSQASNARVAQPPSTAAAHVAQEPTPVKTAEKSTVVLDVAGGVQVPDFSGMPLRSALYASEMSSRWTGRESHATATPFGL